MCACVCGIDKELPSAIINKYTETYWYHKHLSLWSRTTVILINTCSRPLILSLPRVLSVYGVHLFMYARLSLLPLFSSLQCK